MWTSTDQVGQAKSRQVQTRGGSGLKKSKNFADVIYVSYA